MNQNKRHISDIETRTDRLTRILGGSGERPEGEDLKVIRKIARLADEPDFGAEEAYAGLMAKITKRSEKKRKRRLFFAYATSVAALLVLGVFVGIRLVERSAFDRQEAIAKVGANKWLPAQDQNVRLTLNNGQVIDVSLQDLPGRSTNDIKEIEETMQTESVLAYNTLVVPKGRDYRLTLDDGTVLRINSDSQVRFPTEFTSGERRVSVDFGEVFFTVFHDEKRPFIVETRGGEVQVLGTVFNLNAYPELPVTTTLVSGRVRVHHDSESTTLVPGKEAVFTTNGISVREADMQKTLAWMTGEFIFDDLSLANIVNQLERWYDVDMMFEVMSLKEIRFTGVIDKKYTLDEVLDILTKTSEVEFDASNPSLIKIRKKMNKL